MTDEEIFKLTRSISRTGIEKIAFEFADMYCDIVHCTITRSKRGLIPVQECSNKSDDALKGALELLEKIKPWDHLIKMPQSSEQPYEGGYFRSMLDDEHQVEFKRKGNSFVITGISRIDKDGFYYVEEPKPISDKYTFSKDLPDGTQLWTWDNIRFLSGTAGEVIVKDGKIIKSKMTAIS